MSLTDETLFAFLTSQVGQMAFPIWQDLNFERGVAGEEGVSLWRGAQFSHTHKKLKSEIFNDKKSLLLKDKTVLRMKNLLRVNIFGVLWKIQGGGHEKPI